MAFIFTNIPQSAGININEGNAKAQKPSAIGVQGSTGFQAFLELAGISKVDLGLESMSAPVGDLEKLSFNKPAIFANFDLSRLSSGISPVVSDTRNPIPGNQIEVKERVAFNSGILKVILSNVKDTLKITLDGESNPNSAGTTAILPALDIKSVAQVKGRQVDPSSFGETRAVDSFEALPRMGETVLDFEISRLFCSLQKNDISKTPVIINKAGVVEKAAVDVSSLFEILGGYSEPIEIEISNIHESLIPAGVDKAEVKSNFKFDLRELLRPENDAKHPVTGILTVSREKQNQIDIAPKAQVVKPWSPNLKAPDNSHSEIRQGGLDLMATWFKSSGQDKKPASSAYMTRSKDSAPAPLEKTGYGNEFVPKVSSFKANLSSVPSAWQAPEAARRGERLSENHHHQAIPVAHDQAATPVTKTRPSLESGETAAPGRDTARPAAGEMPASNDANRADTALSGTAKAAEIAQSENTVLTAPEKTARAAYIEEIKTAITRSFGQKADSLRIKLRPAHLGELTIRLTYKSEGLSVALKTENREAADLLGRFIPELRNELTGANLKISDISLFTDGDRRGNSHPQFDYSGDPRGHERSGRGNSENPAQQGRFWKDTPDDNEKSQVSASGLGRGWIDLKA